jgi:uncharacterized protein YjaZ
MSYKLTLKLDKNIIEQAKLYAKLKETSLSELVEKYFTILIRDMPSESTDSTPLTDELLGIVQGDETIDLNEGYTNYLIEKYQ